MDAWGPIVRLQCLVRLVVYGEKSERKALARLAFQNLVGEHSVAGVPASLYNLTNSVQ